MRDVFFMCNNLCRKVMENKKVPLGLMMSRRDL